MSFKRHSFKLNKKITLNFITLNCSLIIYSLILILDNVKKTNLLPNYMEIVDKKHVSYNVDILCNDN